jgi:chromosome segregation ATPase
MPKTIVDLRVDADFAKLQEEYVTKVYTNRNVEDYWNWIETEFIRPYRVAQEQLLEVTSERNRMKNELKSIQTTLDKTNQEWREKDAKVASLQSELMQSKNEVVLLNVKWKNTSNEMGPIRDEMRSTKDLFEQTQKQLRIVNNELEATKRQLENARSQLKEDEKQKYSLDVEAAILTTNLNNVKKDYYQLESLLEYTTKELIKLVQENP